MVCGGGSARLLVVSGGAGDAVVSEKLPFASERDAVRIASMVAEIT